jgi:hypothetical protein
MNPCGGSGSSGERDTSLSQPIKIGIIKLTSVSKEYLGFILKMLNIYKTINFQQ